ncbi:ras family-domain-containing protein [Mycena latifolia]|nr:ras family-domain-containing protein [Mycena latifolia]
MHWFIYAYRKQCVIDDEMVLLDVYEPINQEGPSPQRTNVDEAFYNLVREIRRFNKGEDFLLVYSITSRDSFEEISIFHQQILRVKNQEPSRIILVANKCDLEHQRQVSIDEGRDLAKDLGCNFIETSAKLRTNVDEAFSNLVRDIRRFNKEQASAGSTVAGGVGASGSQKNDDAGCTCVVL